MKTFTLILKILAAIAAIAGIIYLVATYGDKVVSWFKRLLGKSRLSHACDDCDCDGDCEDCDIDCCCDDDAFIADADFEE